MNNSKKRNNSFIPGKGGLLAVQKYPCLHEQSIAIFIKRPWQSAFLLKNLGQKFSIKRFCIN